MNFIIIKQNRQVLIVEGEDFSKIKYLFFIWKSYNQPFKLLIINYHANFIIFIKQII